MINKPRNFNYLLLTFCLFIFGQVKSHSQEFSVDSLMKIQCVMKDGNMLELDLTDSLTHRTYKETLRTIDNELDYYYCVFPNSKLTFNKIDEMPRFPGGEEWMHRFIAKKIKYPKDAKKNSISGRVVISFNVDTTGYTSDIFVVEGVYPSIDKEAIRVISILPRFVPAVDNGSKVKVNYKIPIVFEQ